VVTIIPCLEVMRAVTDKNISGSSAQLRVEAFHLSLDLKSLTDVEIILEGKMYERLKARLEDDHKVFFEGACKIDNSVKDVSTYDVISAIKWIANSESKINRVIIIGENTSNFNDIINEDIVCVKPSDFIYKVNKAREIFEKKQFTSFHDSIIAMFFFQI